MTHQVSDDLILPQTTSLLLISHPFLKPPPHPPLIIFSFRDETFLYSGCDVCCWPFAISDTEQHNMTPSGEAERYRKYQNYISSSVTSVPEIKCCITDLCCSAEADEHQGFDVYVCVCLCMYVLYFSYFYLCRSCNKTLIWAPQLWNDLSEETRLGES